jgi:2-hydroxychromene-2-carboxylate isomerase
MPSPLEFWFEFASTYSYVAALRIQALCRDAGVPLVWKPFMLGPVFALQGWNDSHYNLNPRRGAYMWRDMERLCAKLGLPWRQSAEAVLAAAEAPARRGVLRANTEHAIALGIVGSPNCVVEGEVFWGEEGLEDAIAWAHGERWGLAR